MKKQERLKLKEKLEENFIKDFNFEDLKDEEKKFFLEAVYVAIEKCDTYKNVGFFDGSMLYSTGVLSIQNFHILKALKESNDKSDTLIQQNKQIIDLLSKLNEK